MTLSISEPTIPQGVTALVSRAPAFLDSVRVVSNGEDMNIALAELKVIKSALATFKPARAEFLQPLKDALKTYEQRFDDAASSTITKLELAKSSWEINILTYRRQEEARAAEERRRREAVVAQEQAKLRAQAAAAQAKADADAAEKRRKAQEAEEAGRAAQAAKLRSQADSVETAAESKVAVLETTAATMSAGTVTADIPKSEHGHTSKRYSARCDDLQALVLAIAAGIQNGSNFPSISLLSVNQTNLNAQARALKDHFQIAGASLVINKGVVSR